ncbi:unnamed protein product, partial [Amoebophrya sp. A120]|eukprot:GSA120T00015510001.1
MVASASSGTGAIDGSGSANPDAGHDSTTSLEDRIYSVSDLFLQFWKRYSETINETGLLVCAEQPSVEVAAGERPDYDPLYSVEHSRKTAVVQTERMSSATWHALLSLLEALGGGCGTRRVVSPACSSPVSAQERRLLRQHAAWKTLQSEVGLRAMAEDLGFYDGVEG